MRDTARARARRGEQEILFVPATPGEGELNVERRPSLCRAEIFWNFASFPQNTHVNSWHGRACHCVRGTGCADSAPVALAASGFLDRVDAVHRPVGGFGLDHRVSFRAVRSPGWHLLRRALLFQRQQRGHPGSRSRSSPCHIDKAISVEFAQALAGLA